MLNTMPHDMMAMICCFMRIDALVRVQSTCKTLRNCTIPWHDALFAPAGEWYELKDVALAAKYMAWSRRVASPPPSLDTMDNIACWGILVDGDRLLATIGSNVMTIETDITNALEDPDTDGDLTLLWVSETIKYTWTDTKTKQEYTTQLDRSKFDVIHGSDMFFSKQCQFRMYAAVLSSAGVGMYELISGTVESDNVFYPDHARVEVFPTELDFDDANGNSHLNVWADGVEVYADDKIARGFTTEWHEEYCSASSMQRVQMKTAFVKSPANAGRGWNSTRRDVLDKLVAQLH